MALASYVDLRSAVQGWLARGDSLVIDRIPDFIRLGEERIYRDLRHSGMVTPLDLTIPATLNYVALPEDWLAFDRVTTANNPLMEYMAPSDMADLSPPGLASAYSIEGGRFYWGTTPSADSTISTRYYKRPDFLASASSTWLLTLAPSLYLYAALIEGFMFIQNPTQSALYGSLYDKTLLELRSADRAAQVSGSRLRMAPMVRRI